MFNRLFRASIVLAFVCVAAFVPAATAQDENKCDIQTLMTHQVEHGMELADFPNLAQADLDQALEALYRTGIAYQALAVGCGFDRMHQVEEEHLTEHGETTESAQADEHAADGHDEEGQVSAEVEAAIAAAKAAGDAANGEVLFNTVQPETGFACATCHRVDTMERLVGPGLMGVGDPMHDPSQHMMMEAGADEHTDAGSNDGSTMGGMDMHNDQAEGSGDSAMGDMNMNGDMAGMDMEAMMAGRGDNPVEYIRTSILDPGAFVVPGFPDNLMPRVYSEIFTEQEINDLIAYLLTL